MGEQGYDNRERTTVRGKVVYRRKQHDFKSNDLLRILTNYNNRIETSIAREQNNAIKIRAIFRVSQSLYSIVQDMFDRPSNMDDSEYLMVKRIWREGNDEIIGLIADFIAEKSGSDDLGRYLEVIGRMINRGMEYLFTGHTEF